MPMALTVPVWSMFGVWSRAYWKAKAIELRLLCPGRMLPPCQCKTIGEGLTCRSHRSRRISKTPRSLAWIAANTGISTTDSAVAGRNSANSKKVHSNQMRKHLS